MPRNKNKYLKRLDRPFLLTVLALTVFGLIAVSSASSVISYERFGHNNYYIVRQVIFAAMAILAMFTVSRINYHFWRRWSRPIMFFGLLLLALVLIPGIGFRPGISSRSWFKLGDFLLQPSEFVKLALIFYLASWFERKKEAEKNFWFGVLPSLLVAGLAVVLIVLEPDLGSAAMIGVILCVLLFAAGTNLKYLGGLLAFGGIGLWILIQAAPYRAARIITFLDPSVDPRGIGYHINQALLAIGAGGFLGLGFGLSRQKHNYLPEPIGDSIFAVIAEELGFVRIIILIGLFAFLVFRGVNIAQSAPDKFSNLTAIGISTWIGFQAVINIGAISGLLPLTGITLPFVSYGGSSLLALGVAAGVLLNISRHRV